MAEDGAVAIPDGPAMMKGGSEAAAILLMLLSEDEAAEVLSRLEPEEVQQLGGAMFSVADVSEQQVDGVLDLFVDRAKARTTIGFDSDVQIRGMMERALGMDRADNVMARITPPARTVSLDSLKWMDARTIAQLVAHEHPQVAALVLAHLDSGVAADVLQLLDEETQADIVYRVATLGEVSSEALEELERILMKQVTKTSNGGSSKRGGAAEAAKIVNSTRTSAEQRLIKALAKLDKTLARTIEDEMFIFDDLMQVDDKSMGAILRSVENDTLVVALKGADPKLRAKIFGCMSSRAAQSIQDDIADRGPMRLADVTDAQKAVLQVARQLAADGTIMLGGKGDDYV